MTPSFQTILALVGIIEGFSIWQGRQAFDVPKARFVECQLKYIDLSLGKLIASLNSRQGGIVKFLKYIIITILGLFNVLVLVLMFVVNVLIVSPVFLFWLSWWIAYLTARYSVLLSIPALTYCYLGDCHDSFIKVGAFGVEQFLHGEWILWFVMAKTGCYIYAKSIAGIAYWFVEIKAKRNAPSISPFRGGSASGAAGATA